MLLVKYVDDFYATHVTVVNSFKELKFVMERFDDVKYELIE